MGCDFPLHAYRSPELNENKKRVLIFNPIKSINSTSPMLIPCGRCTGCKLERSRQWAVRIMHESKMHDQNCFITLTYSDEAIPTNYSLDLNHWQLFMKKLRFSLEPKLIRFYACGEYGDKLGRPHYHAIVFNHQFSDLKKYSMTKQGPLFTSQTLTNLWQHGHATTGSVTFESAGYVARYAMKKRNNDHESDHYYRQSPIDGNYYNVKPEFAVMSRRPGIGATWFDKFRSDIYPSGFIVVNGKKQAPPKFYLLRLKQEEQTKLKRAARRKSLLYKDNNTNFRRYAKKTIRDQRIKPLKRNLG